MHKAKLKELIKKYDYITKLEDGLENRTLSEKFYNRFGHDVTGGTFSFSNSDNMYIIFSLPNCDGKIDDYWFEDNEVLMYLGIEELK